MTSFNKTILMGRIARDVELKNIRSGTSLVELGIAVNERCKTQNGEWGEAVHFINVTFWGKRAEIISQYLSKGDAILVEGRLKQSRWESDGQAHSRLTVRGEEFSFVGAPQRDLGLITHETETKPRTPHPPKDDIPF